MKVYASSPEKMLFAKSVMHKYFAKICKRYGGCENTFLELKKAPQGVYYVYVRVSLYVHTNFLEFPEVCT